LEIQIQCDLTPDKAGRLFRADHGMLFGEAQCPVADVQLLDLAGDEVVCAVLPAPDGWELVPGPASRELRLNGQKSSRSKLRTGDTVMIVGSSAALRIKSASEPLLEDLPTELLVLNSRTARVGFVPFASALLEVISGPDAGTVYPIVGDVVDIGSDAANSLRLRDPLISAHHARVLRDDQGWQLVDLDSRYGTFVNREPIAISPLGHGDVVQLGTTVLRLSETEDAARETRVAGAGLRDQDVFLLPRVIAHEIKNYLTVLDKSAQELAAAVPAGSGLTANIQRVQLVREHIAELIPMLRVSSMDLSPEPVDVSQLVCEQLTLFERLLSDSLIDSKLDLANKAVAVCDRQRIAHVIMNLIKNAIEAMPHGGKLTVSVRAVNDGVALSFTDTGTGMTPDVAACVFEPLFTTKSGGSGLGLYLVKDLIARHQGTITFNSTPGAGTEFLVWLPRRGYRL